MSKPKEAINEIEWGVIEGENTEFAIQYPRAQWVHGDRKASGFMKTGGLFISAEQYPNFSAEGFDEAILIPSKGKDIPGYGASAAKLAIIRIKHQWVEIDGKNVPLAHVLCVIKGCEDLICISLKGASKALEFQNTFQRHISQNIAVANKTRPQGMPGLEPFALWFPLHAGEYKSAPSKDGTKESIVTYPELVAPETVDRAYVTSLWVGADNYKKFASYWKDTTAWQKQPIWAQKDATDEELSNMTGGKYDDNALATQEQLQHLINVCVSKGQIEKEVALTYSQGSTDRIQNLTVAECRNAVQGLSAL